MIQKAITLLLERKHYWRTVSFDELSELYTSVFLRSLALNIIGIFVPIYLYRIGYSLTDLCLMFTFWFAIRPPLAIVSGHLVARFGPKHTMAIGVVSHIAYLSLLLSMERMHWSLMLVSILGSFAVLCHAIAYEVDFSKVKHREHGGKEVGYAHMFAKVGAVIGPLAGGILASLTDPRYTIVLAIIMMFGSLLPLFMSNEPTRTSQRITYKGYPWRRHKPDFISVPFLGIDATISMVVWPLFVGTVLVVGSQAFAAVGALTAMGTIVVLVAIKLIGRLIDEQQGGLLLRIGVVLNSMVYMARVFVSTPLQALPISIVNEPVTAMYQMPYMKGLFDAADSEPGYRIVYVSAIHAIQSIGPAIFWFVLSLLSLWLPGETLFRVSFVLGAVLTLGILYQRFPALNMVGNDKAQIIRHLASR